MMKKDGPNKLRLEALEKKVKTYKIATIALIVLVAIMSLAVVLPSSKEISLAIKILPITFLPLVVINFITYKKLTKELAERQNQ